MANQWFRMYAEFATDPKVQMLSEDAHRVADIARLASGRERKRPLWRRFHVRVRGSLCFGCGVFWVSEPPCSSRECLADCSHVRLDPVSQAIC